MSSAGGIFTRENSSKIAHRLKRRQALPFGRQLFPQAREPRSAKRRQFPLARGQGAGERLCLPQGQRVLRRGNFPGGKGGGGAVLSPEGELLLERYDELCRRMQAYGAQQYAELFGSGSESAE